MSQVTDKFNFFVPALIEKSGKNGDEMKISGICSSSVEDSDGETLDPTGFDFQPLLKSGFFNWNHQGSKNPSAILGRPTRAEVQNKGKDFFVEGFLYKGSDEAQAVYKLAKVLEEEDPDRRLGFSIEGQAIERDPINPKRIRKAKITGVAITHCPKNPNTLLSIMKGEYSEPFVEEEVKIPIQQTMTKSEVFDLIFAKYSPTIEKAKEIYSFINAVNTKLFVMNGTNITQDTLNKAFELLDQSILKGEDATTTTTTVAETTTTTTEKEETEDEKLEKAKKKQDEMDAMCKSLLDSGMSKGDCIDDMVKKGYDLEQTKSTVERILVDYKRQQDGGDIAAIGKSLELITERIEKGFGEQDAVLKGMVNELNERFKALGEILKSHSEENKELKGQLATITKSFDEVRDRLDKIEKEPNIRKSLTTRTHIIEKFPNGEKPDENTYNLNAAADRKILGERLMGEFQKSQGKNNAMASAMEKAIMDLEISKSLTKDSVDALNRLGIKVFVE